MSSCDLFTAGSDNGHGYRSLMVAGKRVYAHRLVWMQDNGPIPDGLHVMHSCDVRNCVNIDHLSLGTPQDNIDDMWAKGRGNPPGRSKTHCPKGHPYSGTNAKGQRICQTCQKESQRRYHHKNKEAQNEKWRAWREANLEAQRERERAYREKNRDAINARRRARRKATAT